MTNLCDQRDFGKGADAPVCVIGEQLILVAWKFLVICVVETGVQLRYMVKLSCLVRGVGAAYKTKGG